MEKNWETLIAMRNDFVGRDVEVQETGHAWRGPFKDVRLEGGLVVLETAWSAEEGYDGSYTLLSGLPSDGYCRIAAAPDWGSWRINSKDDSVEFRVPMIGVARILPFEKGVLDRTRLQVELPSPQTS